MSLGIGIMKNGFGSIFGNEISYSCTTQCERLFHCWAGVLLPLVDFDRIDCMSKFSQISSMLPFYQHLPVDFSDRRMSLKVTNVFSRVKTKKWLVDRWSLSGDALFINLWTYHWIDMFSSTLMKSNLLY